MRFISEFADMLYRYVAYCRSHKWGSLAWQRHIRQLIEVSGNEQVVGPGLADALQQVKAASGQPLALTAGITFGRHCIAINTSVMPLLTYNGISTSNKYCITICVSK